VSPSFLSTLPAQQWRMVAENLSGDDRSELFWHRSFVLQWLLLHQIQSSAAFYSLHNAVASQSVDPRAYTERDSLLNYLCTFIIPY
jgi:hypothetical protein